MMKTVLNNAIQTNHSARMRSSLSFLKGIVGSAFLLTLAGLLVAGNGTAQTYTTQADGDWNSAATWVGGQIPSATIGAGKTVIIKHDVSFNLTTDLTISGTLQITGDTLRFPVTYSNKTVVSATGTLTVTNGGYLQDMPERKCDMNIDGGRVVFENATIAVSKGMTATAGTRRKYTNATISIGEKYEFGGTSASRVIDTIQSSTLLVSVSTGGNFTAKDYTTVRAANAKIEVRDGDFKLESNAEMLVLAGATNNFAFDRLKVKKDLDNSGSWDARIDAHCVDGNIKGSNMAAIDFTRSEDCSEVTTTGTAAPELVFSNPVLKSGNANKEGAVYRFSNITPGVDAEVKLKKFSRNDIVMQSVDLSGLGWEKAFQPQFGLPGVVQPWQNWYIDFEMTFYKAGTTTKQKMQKVDLTALDVDGDSWSISEYAVFETPSSITYSTVSYLTNVSAGLVGQSFTCALDSTSSPLANCTACGGDGKAGMWNIEECTACDASGLIHSGCNHAFDGANGNTVQGPIENFLNIDTLATQVMATYQYVDRDRIRFRYGAKSGANSSNGSGIRLNSTWFRQFSMAPPSVLPVKLISFTAMLDRKNVNIAWTTASEENFSHFVVERSTDGKNYQAIATVFGGSDKYAFKDMNVSSASSSLYYRLRCVDNTKEATLSQIRMIRLGADQATITLAAFPNPVKDAVRISLPNNWQNKPVMLEVLTANGSRVQAVQVSNASQTEQLQLSTLPKGAYVIKATCEGQTAQQTIIKN